MNIKRRRSKWKSTVVTSRRKPQETNGNENNLESKKSSLSIFLFLVFLLFFPFFTICCFFHHRQKRSKGEEQKAIFRQVENDKRRKELAYYLRSQNEKVKTHQFFLPSIPVSYFFYFLSLGNTTSHKHTFPSSQYGWGREYGIPLLLGQQVHLLSWARLW